MGTEMTTLDTYAKKPMAYFSHDSDAHDDIKMRRLIKRLGLEGYGRFWLLCETLAQCDCHHLPTVDNFDWELVAESLLCDGIDEAKEFVLTLQELGLLAADSDFIWSKRMHENAKKIARYKKGGAMTAKKRWKE